MVELRGWPDAPPLSGPRLQLEPLRLEHAEEMAPLLQDPDLHAYTGGRPSTSEELLERYRRQVIGRSPEGSHRWLNWVVRRRGDGQAVGTVQATLAAGAGGITVEVVWVIATAYQRQGYAREAAREMVAWLRQQGAAAVVAHVHPGHHASAAVARAVGMTPTGVVVDGEIRWQASAVRRSPPGR